MEEVKSWWKSKTIWSDIVTILIGSYEVARATTAIGAHLPAVPPILLTLLGAIGIYGRTKADTVLTK